MNDEKQKTERLGTERIGKLLVSLAIPSIIAQLVNILYNIVDRIYIGRMNNGTLAMSAISIALPIVTFIIAICQLFGTGGAPLASIELGKENVKQAEKIMTNSFVALIGSGLIVTVLILLFADPLLMAFGADSSNLLMAHEYIVIYALGTVFVQIAFGMNPYIITQGFATLGMVTVLIGAILNIVLDPVFIFMLNMGVRGAALATILSQFVSAIWCLSFLFGKKTTIKIQKKYMKPDLKILGHICALGLSPFIMNATESLLQISFNNQLSLYGGTLAVGTMSILLSLFQMVSMPLQGLCQGAQPIMSFNYGAGSFERVRKTFKLLFVSCLTFSIAGMGTVIVFSDFFASVFTSDPQLIRLAGWALKIYLAGAVFFGAQIACQQSFVALGQAKQSLFMALFRKVILLIPLLFALPHFFGYLGFFTSLAAPVADLVSHPGHVAAVLSAEAAADFLAALTTTLFFFSFYRKALSKGEPKAQ